MNVFFLFYYNEYNKEGIYFFEIETGKGKIETIPPPTDSPWKLNDIVFRDGVIYYLGTKGITTTYGKDNVNYTSYCQLICGRWIPGEEGSEIICEYQLEEEETKIWYGDIDENGNVDETKSHGTVMCLQGSETYCDDTLSLSPDGTHPFFMMKGSLSFSDISSVFCVNLISEKISRAVPEPFADTKYYDNISITQLKNGTSTAVFYTVAESSENLDQKTSWLTLLDSSGNEIYSCLASYNLELNDSILLVKESPDGRYLYTVYKNSHLVKYDVQNGIMIRDWDLNEKYYSNGELVFIDDSSLLLYNGIQGMIIEKFNNDEDNMDITADISHCIGYDKSRNCFLVGESSFSSADETGQYECKIGTFPYYSLEELIRLGEACLGKEQPIN